MSALPGILIVEDQRLIAADLEVTLQALGYRVVGSVASGEEAVQRALEARPAPTLMDIRLRGELDGIQAAARIREELDVPVVFLTAYADEKTLARAKGTLPYGYVVKPFNERELRAAIEIALYKHETGQLLAMEQARRIAAEEMKLLVDGVRDYAIFMLDPQGNVSSWNSGAERIFGYPSDEILGRSGTLLFPPELRAAGVPEEHMAQAIRDGRSADEGWRLRKDLSRFWAGSVVTPIYDASGVLRGFGKVLRDLTERKRHEDEQHFLVEASTALVESLDLERTLDAVARLSVPRLADWCSMALLEHGALRRVSLAHPDEAKRLRATELYRTGAVPDDYDLGAAWVARTGQTQLLEHLPPEHRAQAAAHGPGFEELTRLVDAGSLVSVPMKGRAGPICGVATFIFTQGSGRTYVPRDVPLLEDFARRCGMAVENARLYAEAQEAIRARDEFLQVASHELKTPLTPLQIQLESLGRSIEQIGAQNAKLTDRLAMATRQTRRLTRLVNQLLDVSRITAGRLTLELEDFDLAEAVREVAARFAGEAAKAGSTLSVIADGPVMGHWDRDQVEEVLSNLLSNAIKFGSGRPIDVLLKPDGAVARVTVQDHGIGIASESLERIFARFERAVSSRHYGGLGLGLFIARQIAEAHGGSLLARSEPGQGSTFTLLLPVQGAPARRAEPVRAPS